MNRKIKLTPQTTTKIKLNTSVVLAVAGFALATLIGLFVFFYLNFNNSFNALAANYSTTQNGNWSAGSTWSGGSAPGDWAYHNVTINNNITGTVTSGQNKSLNGFGTITLSSGKTFTTTKNLTLNFVGNFLANGGDITINGDFTLDNSTILTINSGNLIVNGTLTVKNSSSINFNSSGSITVTGDLKTSGGSGKTININSGSLNVGGLIDMGSGTTLNIEDGANLLATNLKTGNNADAIININGDATITQDVDLGGVLNIGNTGHLAVGNNYTMRNSGTTATNIDGRMDVVNDITIDVVTMTGSGLLNWGGNVVLKGSGNINGEQVIPPAVLDLSTMNTYVPLPVELLSFKAATSANSVILTWKTATELNNDYFTIERSSNGIEFEAIATVTGSGTTNSETSYDFEDSHPLKGLSYYRLKQTDFDGTTETFRPVSVNMEVLVDNNIEIYPNPLLGSSLKIRMETPEEGNVEIVNQNGNKIFSKQLDGFASDTEMALPSNLVAGIYFVHVKTENVQKTFKLIKK